MSTPPDATLGRRIRFLRIAAGLKQRELAERLGISYQQVQKYESGHDRVSLSRLQDIARIIHVPLAALLEEQQMPVNMGHSRQSLTLMQFFSRIENESVRQVIIDIVRAVAENQSGADA